MRIHSRVSFPSYPWIILLCLLAVLPSLSLLKGDFLFDDIFAIERNPALQSISSLAEIYQFQPQPSRPVANFFLAVGQVISPGNVGGQRFLSLLVHALVVLALFANLSLIFPTERFVVILSTALFAVAPIHSETLAIAQFRSEMLATLFCLFAWGYFQIALLENRPLSLSQFALIFLMLSLSALSKEVFAFVGPALLILYFLSRYRFDRKILSFLTLSGFALSLLVWWLTHLTPSAQSVWTSYHGAVGSNVVDWSWGIHLKALARSLAEGLIKLTVGSGLTTVRMLSRSGPLSSINILQAIGWLTGFGLALGLAAYRFAQIRFWLAAFLVSAASYFILPNINMGSEHYWYAPSLFFFVLVARALSHWIRNRSLRITVAMAIIFFSSVTLATRFRDFKSLADFHFANLEAHPEVQRNWADLIDYLVFRNQSVAPAWKYIEEGSKRFPRDSYFQIAAFTYYLEINDKDQARHLLDEAKENREHPIPEKVIHKMEADLEASLQSP